VIGNRTDVFDEEESVLVVAIFGFFEADEHSIGDSDAEEGVDGEDAGGMVHFVLNTGISRVQWDCAVAGFGDEGEGIGSGIE